MKNLVATLSILGTISSVFACSAGDLGDDVDGSVDTIEKGSRNGSSSGGSSSGGSTSTGGSTSSTCTNIAPDATYTCAQQASWGKCNESWMVGKCNESCGRCSSGSAGSGGSTSTACANPDGTNAVMAALAVSVATELHRWQPKLDLALSGDKLVLTATGKAQCADGKCFNTQALLDMQNDAATNVVKFNGTALNAPALRSRLTAKYQEQLTCESQPDNHNASNCPVEAHVLTLQYSGSGSCDTEYFFEAKTPAGAPLQYPAQLKNKLLWVDVTNPYVNFQHYGEIVSVDPTYGLNEAGSTTAGTCSAACTKISASNIAGQCCSCNGATKTYVRSAFSTSIYLCQ